MRLDAELVVLGAVQLGDLPRVRRLVPLLDVEADRERLDRLGRLLGHRRDHRARVDAAGEEGAEGHVASQAQASRLEQLGADPLVHLLLVGVDVVGLIGELPVAARLEPAVLPREHVAGRQLAQRGERRAGLGDVLEVKERVDRLEVDLTRDLGVLEDRLRLGAEPDRVGVG